MLVQVEIRGTNARTNHKQRGEASVGALSCNPADIHNSPASKSSGKNSVRPGRSLVLAIRRGAKPHCGIVVVQIRRQKLILIATGYGGRSLNDYSSRGAWSPPNKNSVRPGQSLVGMEAKPLLVRCRAFPPTMIVPVSALEVLQIKFGEAEAKPRSLFFCNLMRGKASLGRSVVLQLLSCKSADKIILIAAG